MDTIGILGLFFLGLIVILIIEGIWTNYLENKERKYAWKLLNNFENIRKLKKTNPSEFMDKCFKIITGINPEQWHGFRVRQSIHGKGWFVEGDYFDEKRFWPSGDKFGNNYYPNSYLSKKDAEKELLNVLEGLVDFIIYWENVEREFGKRRED